MNFTNDYYVISSDFKLIEFNRNVAEYYKGIKKGDLCYKATMDRSTPCLHCPIAGNSQSDCPIYYDPFHKSWMEAIFSQNSDGNYSVICRPADATALALLGNKIVKELAGKVNGQAVNNELKNLLKTRMSIMEAMNRIYFATYYVDVQEDTFIKLNSNERINALLDVKGKAKKTIDYAINNIVASDFRAGMKKFLDFSTLDRRLKNTDILTRDYISVKTGWCQIYVILGDRDAKGNVRHIFIAFKENNEEKKRELKSKQDLLEATRVLVVLQNALGASMWRIEYDENQNITRFWWSDELVKNLGYSGKKEFPESVSSIRKLVSGDDKYRLRRIFKKVISDQTGGEVFNGEFRLKNKKGEYRWYRIVGKPVDREASKRGLLYGLLIDIDEEKLKEIKIAESLKVAQDERISLKTLHAALNSGRWIMNFDDSGEMVGCHWSRQFINMLGYRDHMDFPDQLESWTDLIHPEDKEFVLKEYWDTISDYTDRKNFDVKYRLNTKDRGFRWFHTVGRLTRQKDGTPISFHGIFQDIDRQVQAEKELEEQSKQLKVAVEEAQRASRAKTEFLFNMSHDIRTPMNAIIGFTNLLEKHGDDEQKRRDYITKINYSSHYLLELINNVLEMSRIESGKMILDEGPIRVKEFIENLDGMLGEQFESKTINFAHKIDIKSEYLIFDPVKVQEIFMNLMSNAIKYTPEGGDIFMCTVEHPGDKEGYARMEVTVQDNGIGMSKDFIPHIFEEFSRESNSTISRVIGTGLGMPITKKLVELMGGTIEVESELGMGTKITVNINHKIAHDYVPSTDEKTLEEINGEKFKGKRILLAEDNELNAEIATEILKELGFLVEYAEDGVVCVDKVIKSKPGYFDLILMDVQMPNLNGYLATEKIRRLGDSKKDIPIIAMTANAFDEDRYNAMAAGMSAHVAKPIDVRKLMEAIASVL